MFLKLWSLSGHSLKPVILYLDDKLIRERASERESKRERGRERETGNEKWRKREADVKMTILHSVWGLSDLL